MYGDSDEFTEEVAATKKEWLKANTLYKKLLQQRSLVLGQVDVVEDFYAGAEQIFGQTGAKTQETQTNQIKDDKDKQPATSSSSLTDGLYCLPLKDNEVSPSTLAAIRKVQENADEEETVQVQLVLHCYSTFTQAYINTGCFSGTRNLHHIYDHSISLCALIVVVASKLNFASLLAPFFEQQC